MPFDQCEDKCEGQWSVDKKVVVALSVPRIIAVEMDGVGVER